MFKKLVLLATVIIATLSYTDALLNANAGNSAHNVSNIAYTVGANEVCNIHVHAGINHIDTITYPKATYISVRFSDFNLPPGDEVLVRSPDSKIVHRYTGKGRNDAGSFIASFVRGDTAIVEYISTNKNDVNNGESFGYTIPGFARGFPSPTLEYVCGTDQSIPAKCFQEGTPLTDLPLAYNKARAVARLLLNGTHFCTGWLAGSEGHLITNNHCVGGPAMAMVTDIEFEAESASCADECQVKMGCKGTVVTSSPTFVTTSRYFDYTVLKVPSAAPSKYGYLQLRRTGFILGEEIYMPQHPAGWAKRIAYKTDNEKKAVVESFLPESPCGDNQIAYSIDTRGGSSGSPVLASTDNLVVSLHHCGACQNQGVNTLYIMSDLKKKGIEINDLVIGNTLPPTPAPTPKSNFCTKFTSPIACQAWIWCTWDSADTDTCISRW